MWEYGEWDLQRVGDLPGHDAGVSGRHLFAGESAGDAALPDVFVDFVCHGVGVAVGEGWAGESGPQTSARSGRRGPRDLS